MGYFDQENTSSVSGRTAHSIRSKKPKVVVKKRARSYERSERSERDKDRRPAQETYYLDSGSGSDRDRERDRDRDRRRRRRDDRSRSRDRAPSLRDTAASIVDDYFPSSSGSSNVSRSKKKRRDNGLFGGWDVKNLLGGIGLGGEHSRSGWTGVRSSYYKRSSRHNLITHTVQKIKKLVAELVEYAKTHPAQVFALVIVPLVTGGALTAALAKIGVRMPRSIERLIHAASRMAQGDPSALVSEAVRMVNGDSGRGGRSMVVTRGVRAGDYRWERRDTYRDGEGWGDSLKRLTRGLF